MTGNSTSSVASVTLTAGAHDAQRWAPSTVFSVSAKAPTSPRWSRHTCMRSAAQQTQAARRDSFVSAARKDAPLTTCECICRASGRRTTVCGALLRHPIRMGDDAAAPPLSCGRERRSTSAEPSRLRRAGCVQTHGVWHAHASLHRHAALTAARFARQSEVLANLWAETDAAAGTRLRRTITHPAGHRPLPPGREAAAVVDSVRTFWLEQQSAMALAAAPAG